MWKMCMVCLSILLFLNEEGRSQPVESAGTLTFNISGFKMDTGQVIVQLFRKEDRIPRSPFKQLVAKILDRKAIVLIDNLPYGLYGAIVVHDQNLNGIIDHRWGIPSEPLGYSNKWQLSLFSGMPTFEKLKFAFSEKVNICNVRMNE